jgi:hypothetical protein
VVLGLRIQATIFSYSVSVFIPSIRSWTPDPVRRCCGFCSVAELFSFPSFLSFKRSLPGRLLPWRCKRPASKSTEGSNRLRRDLGFLPRLNFVELGLLLPKSPLWFFRPKLRCCFLFALSGLFCSGARTRAVFFAGLQSSLGSLLLSVLAPGDAGVCAGRVPHCAWPRFLLATVGAGHDSICLSLPLVL